MIFSIICLSGINAGAQIEANYWTHQYGSKGQLLNGAVIASPDGETSTFYNPGAIGMDDDLGFLFSYITPTYSSLRTQNILGDGTQIRDRGLNFAPGYFGLRLRPFQNKNITVALSNFERYDSSIRLDDREVSDVVDFPDLIYRFDLDFRRNYSEKWRGIGIAYNISDNVGFGLSQFSVWRRDQFNLESVSEIQSIEIANVLSQFKRHESTYRFNINSAFITKLGFSYKSENLCLGLTYTSPQYGTIHKSATYNIEDQLVDDVNGKTTSRSNRDNTSNLTYKSPHSVGLGLDIHRGGTSVSISSEYFFGIDRYQILNEMTTAPNEAPFRVASENEAVLNFAVGIQRDLSEKTSLVFGFRTDFNQKNILSVNDNPNFLGIVGNVYHFSGGNLIEFKNNQFSCGFDLAFAKRSNGTQLVDLAAISPAAFPDLGGKKNVTNRFHSFTIFFTYDFIFDRFRKSE